MTSLQRFASVDPGEQAISAVAGSLVFLAFVSVFALPQATIYLLGGFVAVTAYGWVTDREQTAKFLFLLMTVSTVLILGLITIYLLVESVPAFSTVGLDLFVQTQWSSGEQVYTLVPMIWGTFVTTIIAMFVAGPLGLAGAIFLSEIAPGWAREITKPAIEVMAGIPSIVYGFLGYIVFSKFLMRGSVLELPQLGSLFAVGIVIGLMALPTVVSVAEDALTAVPDSMRDGSHALGVTDWQTTNSVTLPAAFSGVSAAVILGVGRVVGETMAATVILANVTRLPDPLTDVFGNTITLTSLIANQHGTASGLQLSVLFAAGVVLFITVISLSIGSQYIEARMQRKLGGKQ
ncbi:ABC-type phosphate transport system, permease component [Halapricum desulfuricans]|uniref:Phosphate transport system permease protein n=1 Tax=Halapricum desulfuricans TaxID=2841257 RepID=A0A897NLD9_9EURY|nr:phosphate ABC transporter permease subunit PstC [Halapricum desulfuricans]QSG11046.1 ABC-type phosphate transport system, permease component [Halapricum desulfuricans]